MIENNNNASVEVDTPVEPTEANVEPNVEESQTDTEETTQPDYTELLNAINSKAVYKGEPMNIKTFDDVITAVQMKENYQPTHDRMTAAEARVNELENSSQRKFMTKFLTDNGYETFDEYETALKIDELTKEGMSEERAIEYINGQKALEIKNEKNRKEQIEKDRENLDVENNIDAINWYKEKGYGELTAEKISDITWQKVNDGVPLRYAIMEQMFDTVKGDTEQDVLKKLQKKKDTSMGSLTSTNEKQTKSFADMSDAEFAKVQEQVKNGTYKKSFRK